MDGRLLASRLQMETDNRLSLENPPQEMKKNAQWWQIITLLAGLVVPFTIFLVGMAKTQSAQEERLRGLENKQYDNQLKVEKEFDKLGSKMDQLNSINTQILIELQNKVDRPK